MNNSLVEHIRKQSSPLEPIPTELTAKLETSLDLKAIIFDIYGTLFISGSGDISLVQNHDRQHLFIQALTKTGFNPTQKIESIDLNLIFKTLIADAHQSRKSQGVKYPEVNILEIWEALTEKGYTEGWISEKGNLELLAISFEVISNPIYPMPNLKKTLNHLNKKISHLGIVSNAQFYTPLAFNAFLDNDYQSLGFTDDLCFWSYKMLEAKPSTHPFQKLADRLKAYNISPEQTLYVGNDMRNDITPSHALGFKTALFAGDKRSLRLREGDPLVHDVSPDYIITDLIQLIDFVR